MKKALIILLFLNSGCIYQNNFQKSNEDILHTGPIVVDQRVTVGAEVSVTEEAK